MDDDIFHDLLDPSEPAIGPAAPARQLPGFEADVNTLIDNFQIKVLQGAPPSLATFKYAWQELMFSFIHQAVPPQISASEFTQLLYAVTLNRLDNAGPFQARVEEAAAKVALDAAVRQALQQHQQEQLQQQQHHHHQEQLGADTPHTIGSIAGEQRLVVTHLDSMIAGQHSATHVVMQEPSSGTRAGSHPLPDTGLHELPELMTPMDFAHAAGAGRGPDGMQHAPHHHHHHHQHQHQQQREASPPSYLAQLGLQDATPLDTGIHPSIRHLTPLIGVLYCLYCLRQTQPQRPRVNIYTPLPLLQLMVQGVQQLVHASVLEPLAVMQALVRDGALLVGALRLAPHTERHTQRMARRVHLARGHNGLSLNPALMTSRPLRDALLHIRSGLHMLADVHKLVQLCDKYDAARERIFQRRPVRDQAPPPVIFPTSYPTDLQQAMQDREATVKAAMLPSAGPGTGGGPGGRGGKGVRVGRNRAGASVVGGAGDDEGEEAAVLAAAAPAGLPRAVVPGMFGSIVRKQLARSQLAGTAAGTGGGAGDAAAQPPAQPQVEPGAVSGEGHASRVSTPKPANVASVDALRGELQSAGLLLPGDEDDRALAELLGGNAVAVEVVARDRARRAEQSQLASAWVTLYEQLMDEDMDGDADGTWEDMPDLGSLFGEDEDGGVAGKPGQQAEVRPAGAGLRPSGKRAGHRGSRQAVTAVPSPQYVEGEAEEHDEELAAALESWAEEEEAGGGAEEATQQQEWDEEGDGGEEWEDSEDEAEGAQDTGKAVQAQQVSEFAVLMDPQHAASQAAARALPSKRASTASWLKPAVTTSVSMPQLAPPMSQPAKPQATAAASGKVRTPAASSQGRGRGRGSKRSRGEGPSDGATEAGARKQARTSQQATGGAGAAVGRGQRGRGHGRGRGATGAGPTSTRDGVAVGSHTSSDQQGTSVAVDQRMRSPSPSTAAGAAEQPGTAEAGCAAQSSRQPRLASELPPRPPAQRHAKAGRGPAPTAAAPAATAVTSNLATAHGSHAGHRDEDEGMSLVTDVAGTRQGCGHTSALRAPAAGTAVAPAAATKEGALEEGLDDADAEVMRLAREAESDARRITAQQALARTGAAADASGRPGGSNVKAGLSGKSAKSVSRQRQAAAEKSGSVLGAAAGTSQPAAVAGTSKGTKAKRGAATAGGVIPLRGDAFMAAVHGDALGMGMAVAQELGLESASEHDEHAAPAGPGMLDSVMAADGLEDLSDDEEVAQVVGYGKAGGRPQVPGPSSRIAARAPAPQAEEGRAVTHSNGSGDVEDDDGADVDDAELLAEMGQLTSVLFHQLGAAGILGVQRGSGSGM